MIKLLISLFLLSGSLVTANAQDMSKPYKIKGYIKGLQTPNGYMYLQGTINGKTQKDSVQVTGGHFTFTGNAEPAMIKVFSLRVGHPHYINPINFFLDAGTITITATYDTTEFTWLNDVKIKGSASHDEFEKFNHNVRKLTIGSDYKKKEQALKEAINKKDSGTANALQKEFYASRKKRVELTDKYIATHPKSFVSLYFLSENAMTTDESRLNESKRKFMALDPSIQFSANGKKVSERMAFASRGMIMNKLAGDFSQPTPDGKTVKLSDFKGKYVLLDFWASWCGPCRAENPNVLAAYNKYKDKGFDVLAVSLDRDAEKWKKAIEEDKLPWTQVSDLKQVNNAAANQFGVSGIPDNFLIDPNGIVIARGLRGESLDKKLAEVFEKK